MNKFILLIALFSIHANSSDLDKLYIGVNAGYSWGQAENIDYLHELQGFTLESNPPHPYKFTEDDDYSSRLVGAFVGYQFLPCIALEFDYSQVINGSVGLHAWGPGAREESPDYDMGFTQVSGDIYRKSLSVVTSYAVGKEFDIFARVGYGSSSGSYRAKSTGVYMEPENNMTHVSEDGFLFGLGVKFHNEHYFMRLEAQRDLTGIENMGAHMDSVILGFGRLF